MCGLHWKFLAGFNVRCVTIEARLEIGRKLQTKKLFWLPVDLIFWSLCKWGDF